MSGPVGLYKPDAIPMVGLAGMLRRMDDLLEMFARRRPWILERAAELSNDAVTSAYDSYVEKQRQERDKLAALLAADEQQLEAEDV